MRAQGGIKLDRRTRARIAAALAAAALGACATAAKSDIRAGLERLGLGEDGARCFARELETRLDSGDMRRVAELIQAASQREDFLASAQSAGSFEIAGAVTAASAACIFRAR
ncbi:MAG: hypothetical protein Tsb0010_05900 [Parvularculaceae bacterium]